MLVQWANGDSNRYRVGFEGFHDLVYCESAKEQREREEIETVLVLSEKETYYRGKRDLL